MQMIAAHEAATVFLARAHLPGEDMERVDANVRRSAMMMRLFLSQVEALSKLKGTTREQKVTLSTFTSTMAAKLSLEFSEAQNLIGGEGGRMPSSEAPLAQRRRGWLKNGNAPGDFLRRFVAARKHDDRHRVGAPPWQTDAADCMAAGAQAREPPKAGNARDSP